MTKHSPIGTHVQINPGGNDNHTLSKFCRRDRNKHVVRNIPRIRLGHEDRFVARNTAFPPEKMLIFNSAFLLSPQRQDFLTTFLWNAAAPAS